jgi:PAS domain S-box-containing protein
MDKKLRNSGIDIIGDVPWGTHFCQFYQTREDLMDILVPYFKAGLENNEFCMWVTSKPLDVEEAKEALRKAVPNIEIYLEKGQIEIIPYTHWYVKDGVFDSQRVLNGWVEKLNQALANGHDGLRLTGNTFWLEKKDWNDFIDYEEEVDRVLGNYQMIALCTYCLDRCNATEIIDVVTNHQFALIKREGKWEQIESSKRKQAEEALLQATEHERFLADVVENANMPFGVGAPDGRLLMFNQAFVDLTGYSREELIQKQMTWATDLTPPEWREAEAARLAEALRNRQPVRYEKEYLRKDGTRVPIELFVQPVFDTAGNLLHYRSFLTDITERKQAEEALRENEEKYAAIFNKSPFAITLTRMPQGTTMGVNDAFLRLFEYTRGEVIGKTSVDLGITDAVSRAQVAAELDARGSVHNLECTRTTNSGLQITLSINLDWVSIGGQKHILTTIQDVTERKQAEEALRESEAKYRDVFETVQEVFYIDRLIYDEQGNVVDWIFEDLNRPDSSSLV